MTRHVARTTVSLLVAVTALACSAPSSGAAAGPSASDPAPAGSAVAASGSDDALGRPPVLDGEPWLLYQWPDTATGRVGVFLARPDGTDAHRLLDQPVVADADLLHADWSPDGSQVAFEALTDAASVWLVDFDGSDPREVVTCSGPPCLQMAYPAWSPDGRSLVVIRYDVKPNGDWGSNWLVVVDLATGTRTRVARVPGDRSFYQPRWSGDGTRIVVEVDAYTDASQSELVSSRIGVVRVDGRPGQAARLITKPRDGAGWPDWHPTRNRIVFASYDLGPYPDDVQASNIFTIRPDGRRLRQVTDDSVDGTLRYGRPAWTPDGASVVVTVRRTYDDRPRTTTPGFLDLRTGLVTEVQIPAGSPRLRPTG